MNFNIFVQALHVNVYILKWFRKNDLSNQIFCLVAYFFAAYLKTHFIKKKKKKKIHLF